MKHVCRTLLIVCLLIAGCSRGAGQNPVEQPPVDQSLSNVYLDIPNYSQRVGYVNQCGPAALAPILRHFELVEENDPAKSVIDLRERMMASDPEVQMDDILPLSTLRYFVEHNYPSMEVTKVRYVYRFLPVRARDTAQGQDAASQAFLRALAYHLQRGAPVLAIIDPKQLRLDNGQPPYDWPYDFAHFIVLKGMQHVQSGTWMVIVNDPLWAANGEDKSYTAASVARSFYDGIAFSTQEP